LTALACLLCANYFPLATSPRAPQKSAVSKSWCIIARTWPGWLRAPWIRRVCAGRLTCITRRSQLQEAVDKSTCETERSRLPRADAASHESCIVMLFLAFRIARRGTSACCPASAVRNRVVRTCLRRKQGSARHIRGPSQHTDGTLQRCVVCALVSMLIFSREVGPLQGYVLRCVEWSLCGARSWAVCAKLLQRAAIAALSKALGRTQSGTAH
jgi:hypothetical protein